MTNHESLSKSVISRALAFAAVTLVPAAAAADYVCVVQHMPGSSTRGTEGYVYFSTYTQPGCTGTFLGAHTFCSPGATHSSCVSSTAYRYDRSALLTQVAALQRAALADEYMVLGEAICLGGLDYCATVAAYYSASYP